MPKKEQDLRAFARELCLEHRVSPRDNYARSVQKTDPRLQGWITESRKYLTCTDTTRLRKVLIDHTQSCTY